MSEELAARLVARLTSDRGAEEWRANAPKLWDALLATKLGDVVDAGALADALDSVLSRAFVEGAAKPLSMRATRTILEELEKEGRASLGDHVSKSAKEAIDRLLERPGLVPARMLREAASSDAIEEVMRDVLYDAIVAFSQRANPLAIAAKLMPFGMGKALLAVKDEFERRLEPEVRRFLQAFARVAIDKSVRAVIENGDAPRFVDLRKKLATFVFELEIAREARALDRSLLDASRDIAHEISAHVLEEPRTKARRRAWLVEAIAARADRTVGEVLNELGVTWRPDLDLLARATWPLARALVSSEPAKRWLASIDL